MKKVSLALVLLSVILGLFTVSASAGTFGTDAQPVIKEIQFHNVDGFNSTEREDKDNLIESITPSSQDDTLNISKYNSTQKFRYDFIIENGGDTEWVIEDNDQFFHHGIDSGNWSIDTTNDVWYQIGTGPKRRGGTITNNNLTWDTSNAGTLSPDETMEGSYIFNTSQEKAETYNQNFRIENTGGGAGSFYEHNTSISLIDPGFLNVTLYEPPEDTRLQLNRTFEVNSTVECLGGECGDVDLSARYNESGSRLDIPESSSEPFYSIGSNPKTCQGMEAGDSCNFNWDINATGADGSNYTIDTEASSALSQVENNQSEKNSVNIDFFLIVSDTRNTTSFGAVDPNTTFNPALGNSGAHGHQITVDNYSQPVDSLYLQVNNLTSYFTEGYRIGPGNFSYSFENDTSTSERSTGDYDKIKSDIQPGTTVDLFYWLDVPSGIVQDYYNGTATFVAASEN